MKHLVGQNPSSSGQKSQAEIISRDQGGQEFDPLADKVQGSETPEDSQRDDKQPTSKSEVVEDDQGGQDFEPLEIKRAADWSKQ